jgi:hypothetical protein
MRGNASEWGCLRKRADWHIAALPQVGRESSCWMQGKLETQIKDEVN